MQILNLDSGYWQAESDLCKLHRVPDSDEEIDRELQQIHVAFAARFPQLTVGKEYEFPDWHHNLRLFWAYLYHDDFYTPELIPFVQQLLQAVPRSWFSEFECYSPALIADSNPTGSIGTFLIYKDTIVFDGCERWPSFMPRLGIQ